MADNGRDGIPGTLSGAVDAFFSTECDPYRRPWEIWLIPGAAHGRTAVAVKVHHTLGDSRTIVSALTALLDGPSRPDPAAGRGGMPARGERPGRRDGARALARDCLHVIRGLGHLAAAGRAPGVSVCGPFTASRRRYLPVALPARDVARTARRLDAQIADLLPPPVQRLAALQLYRRRWFNLLVSVFPGTRRSYRLLGARVEEAYPVLALADGVGWPTAP